MQSQLALKRTTQFKYQNYLGIALFTVVCVSPLKKFPLNVLLQGVDQVAVVSYINRDHTEGLLLRVAVGAALANLLIGKRAAEHFAHHLILPDGLERLVQALHQAHEELDSVLLLAQVHRLSLQPESNTKLQQLRIGDTIRRLLEVLPKPSRNIVLQFAVGQVPENSLHLFENADVVLFARLL
jgi:hypothetical protein